MSNEKILLKQAQTHKGNKTWEKKPSPLDLLLKMLGNILTRFSDCTGRWGLCLAGRGAGLWGSRGGFGWESHLEAAVTEGLGEEDLSLLGSGGEIISSFGSGNWVSCCFLFLCSSTCFCLLLMSCSFFRIVSSDLPVYIKYQAILV